MIKEKMIFCFIVLMLFLGCTAKKKFVKPGGEYENEGENTIYLLMPLKPGESFKNTSDETFKILQSPKDFLVFSDQLKIDFMIETASVSLGSKIDSLESLQDELNKSNNIEK